MLTTVPATIQTCPFARAEALAREASEKRVAATRLLKEAREMEQESLRIRRAALGLAES